jgi:outer membrane protein assembly factor BamB
MSDGKPVWVFEGSGPVYSSPVAVRGRIVHGDNSGEVYFLDPRSGKRRGGFRAGGAVQAVAAGPGGSVLLGSRDGFLYAVSLETEEGRDR